MTTILHNFLRSYLFLEVIISYIYPNHMQRAQCTLNEVQETNKNLVTDQLKILLNDIAMISS